MATESSEVWAFCAACQRWYYCEHRGTALAPHCPVCSSEPATIENRSSRDSSEDQAVGWEANTDRPNPAGWRSLDE